VVKWLILSYTELVKILVGLLFFSTTIGLWWFQASVALRQCYLEHVEAQNANKFVGVLSSGLGTERQIELNDLVIDSYPECDERIADEYFMPGIGMQVIASSVQ
jgi:hypothetical protein